MFHLLPPFCWFKPSASAEELAQSNARQAIDDLVHYHGDTLIADPVKFIAYFARKLIDASRAR